jgi:hypothetical protein
MALGPAVLFFAFHSIGTILFLYFKYQVNETLAHVILYSLFSLFVILEPVSFIIAVSHYRVKDKDNDLVVNNKSFASVVICFVLLPLWIFVITFAVSHFSHGGLM